MGPQLALHDLELEASENPHLSHFRVITRVEGREIRTKRVKGWAGWTPVSEGEGVEFQELVLCTRTDNDEAATCESEDGEVLVLLQDRLVKAAAELKTTTTSYRTSFQSTAENPASAELGDVAAGPSPQRHTSPTVICWDIAFTIIWHTVGG